MVILVGISRSPVMMSEKRGDTATIY